jgi:hypothetical protein
MRRTSATEAGKRATSSSERSRTVTAKRFDVVLAAERAEAVRPSSFKRRSGSCISTCVPRTATSWVVLPCLSFSPQ